MDGLDIAGVVLAIVLIVACVAWPIAEDSWQKDDLDDAIDKFTQGRK